MESYESVLSPINYGGCQLKNRIIFAPTTMGMKNEEYFAKIKELARGGCAMLIIGDVPVTKSMFAPTLFSKKGFKFYQTITSIAHEYDCKVCAQLHQSDTPMGKMFKYIPKLLTKKIDAMDLRTLMNEETGNYISELSVKKVKKITSAFGPAAQMAVKAGFDMVQVHGDRMCGSFSSTVFNHRTDMYGGSAENRARFAVEAVQSIRQLMPDLPIEYKLAVRQENPHYGNAGVVEEELGIFLPMLEKAGVTSFHVALANHSKLENTIPPRNHPEFSAEGCFLKFCDEVRQFSKLPLTGVGGLSNPDFINEQIASGRIDCASMSRQLIADSEWVNKVREGHPEKIRRCVRCNKKCLGGMYEHKGVHCIYDRKGN